MYEERESRLTEELAARAEVEVRLREEAEAKKKLEAEAKKWVPRCCGVRRYMGGGRARGGRGGGTEEPKFPRGPYKAPVEQGP